MTPSVPPPLPGQRTHAQWFYADENNDSVGPFSFEQLVALAREGTVHPNTLVISEGETEWKYFAQVSSSSETSTPPPLPSAVSSPRIPAKLRRKPLPLVQWWRGAPLKTRFGIVAAMLLVLTVLIGIAGSNKKAIQAVTGDTLTKDERKWRLAKPKAKMYSDEKAFVDAQAYLAQGRTVPLYRMASEDRCFSHSLVRKVELVKQDTQFATIRLYSRLRDRTYEVLISPDDLMPYDAALDKRALEEGETKSKEQIARRIERMKLVGKQVAIRQNAVAYADVDVLWEQLELSRDGKDVTEKIATWVKEGKVLQVGSNSAGVVVSADGPLMKWIVLESKIGVKPLQLWVLNEDVSLIPEEKVEVVAAAPKEDVGIRQFKKFRLGDFNYTIGACEVRSWVGPRQFRNVDASSGASFVVVSYTIENMGNKTKTVMADDFLIRDAKGREFRPSSKALTALLMEEENKDYILSELQPGIEKDSVTAFEVPNNALAGKLVLIVPEKGFFSSKKIEVSIRAN